jgi:hypothetical protein
MFDLRNLDHSTIIYEDSKTAPLLRLAWNLQDPNYIAVRPNCRPLPLPPPPLGTACCRLLPANPFSRSFCVCVCVCVCASRC